MGNNSSVEIDVKTWPQGTWSEKELPVTTRNKNINTYHENELISFGRTNIDFLKKKYGNDFIFTDKGQNFFDGVRNDYTDPVSCCLTNTNFTVTNDGVNISCGDYTKNFNNDFCDITMYEEVRKNSQNPKCLTWIRAIVQRNSAYVKILANLFRVSEMRNSDYLICFMNALRDFATEKNGYNNLADEIILGYSDEIKKEEYKCAFSSYDILEKQKMSQTPKECFYRECVISPRHKLLYANLKQRERCTNTVCDIDIKNLQMSKQELQIICKNKFQQNRLETLEISTNKDIKDIFFVPTFQNTLLPLFLLMPLLVLFNR